MVFYYFYSCMRISIVQNLDIVYEVNMYFIIRNFKNLFIEENEMKDLVVNQ